MACVALRKESVDRNYSIKITGFTPAVALRKESVDRNIRVNKTQSPPRVALRKESVDRNHVAVHCVASALGRSPQGERG